jgi:hypothetical protein
VDITGITFFAVPTTTISGDFTVNLSTTSAKTTFGPRGLSDIYATNIGADNAQFFSGTVTDVLSFSGGPFPYNPSQGNLLLDVKALLLMGSWVSSLVGATLTRIESLI